MDAFENIIAELFFRRGFWVRNSVRVNLTQDDKRAIGRPTSPRWEIDVVTYKPAINTIEIIECKSYLDSSGVNSDFITGIGQQSDKFKLFSDPILRNIVFNRLAIQFLENEMCMPDPKIILSLACGKIQPNARQAIVDHFRINQWNLYDDKWLKNELISLSSDKYENNILTVAAKIAFR